ncbi:MAG: hypothetical protein H6853_05010 [Rhodospirillales bacterium]|nr:hypothetical protein [Alphaproteobacteria bacterium]USO02912.1 MAG: hypothetical protein H6853_05010 [Rhodospirillales bacterium]
MKIEDLSLEEFRLIPDIYISHASDEMGRHRDKSYRIPVEVDGETVDVLLTSFFNSDADPHRTENLDRYQNNPKAMEKALGRVWKQVAAGGVLGLKMRDWEGNHTAVVMRADSLPPPAVS